MAKIKKKGDQTNTYNNKCGLADYDLQGSTRVQQKLWMQQHTLKVITLRRTKPLYALIIDDTFMALIKITSSRP